MSRSLVAAVAVASLVFGIGDALAQTKSKSKSQSQRDKDWEICEGDEDKKAIDACTRLIRAGGHSSKDWVVAYYNRGLSYRRLDENDKAIADYDKALEYDKTDPEIYNNRGVAIEAKGDLDRAMADYDKAISLNPKFAVGYGNRGDIHVKRRDFEKALAEYERAVTLDPKLKRHDDVASTAAKLGRFDKAIASASRAIIIDDKNSAAYFARGVSHYFKGDYAKASGDMRRSIDIDTFGIAMSFRFLARTRLGENAASELEADMTRLKTREWPYSALEFLLGKRSTDDLRAAAVNDDERCDASYIIAQWHLAKNNREAGIAELRKSAEVCDKDNFEHMGSREELKRIGG